MNPPLQMIVVDADGAIAFVGRVRTYEVRRDSRDRTEFVVTAQSTSEEPWV